MRRFLILLIFVLSLCFTLQAEARKHALLIGVDEYDGVPSLKCCVNDVKALKEALIKVGFEEDDIQMLVTGGEYKNLPTKKKIERKLEELFDSAGPSDLVFISFSGHGAQEGEKVYFCPPDVEADDLEGTCVSITKMMDDLAACKAKFKWVVVDACRNDPTQSAKGIGGKGLQAVPAPPAGIALFQSCAQGEESWEDRDAGNGYFTKNFTAALSGEADTDHDGLLTLMEVCKWTTAMTKEQVMNEKQKAQSPYFSGSVSDFSLTEDLNVPQAKALAAEAQKAMEAENYALAVEKFDAAITLYPKVDSWKRERDLAKKFIKTLASAKKLQPTSRASFEWDGTKIKKFIGEETEVVIPEGVTVIGESAFYGCSSLTSVVIPEGVTVIKRNAFSDCSSLTSVVIPEGVTVIEEAMFDGCSSLKSVVIPEGVAEIGDMAFRMCSSLTSVVIPKSVTKIGEDIFGGTFSGCSSLTSVIIPEGVTVIGGAAFSGCRSLTSVVIPEGVTEIGDYAFRDCSSLTSVVIPEGVTKIGSSAFSGCCFLKSVVLPNSVHVIGYGAFGDCTALKQWSISSNHPHFKTDGTGLLTRDGKKLVACLASATDYRIPEGVTEIGNWAFMSCSSLKSVVIPNSVQKIDGGAFAGGTALKQCSISSNHPHFKTDGTGLLTRDGKKLVACLASATEYRIPEGVTEIGRYAFGGCSSLASVVIPEGVTKIEGYAFSGCSSLTSVVIPEGVTEIGDTAFKDCPKLTIHGKKGSKAEEYAKGHKIPFEVQ